MKILITGGTGQLGSDCRQILEQKFEVVSLGSRDLDITNMTAVDRLVDEVSPDVILNCAAFTKVDECEIKRELAWKVNVEGPTNLATASKRQWAKFIHISTDYVFDGSKKVPEPYTETDSENPISYYGVTKYEAEKAVIRATDNHTILRTAWLYGIQGHNFLKTILSLAFKNPEKKIKVVNDQFGSPTWTFRLAMQIEKLVEMKGRGTYHATSNGYCTWYELAIDFLAKMGLPNSFVPCTTEEYPTRAIRPTNSILENQCLKEAGVDLMQDWKIDLEQFVSTFKERLVSEVGPDS
jgi:dTDP-4-dehydrorhamnose reductase